MMHHKCCFPLSAVCLGIALGVTHGLGILLFAWSGWLWGYGVAMTDTMVSIYPGYAPTLLGGIYGALWGLLCGFVFGVVAAWIYNLCLASCKHSHYCEEEHTRTQSMRDNSRL